MSSYFSLNVIVFRPVILDRALLVVIKFPPAHYRTRELTRRALKLPKFGCGKFTSPIKSVPLLLTEQI